MLGGDPSPVNHSFPAGVTVCGSTRCVGSGFSWVQVHTVITPSNNVSLGPEKVWWKLLLRGWMDRQTHTGKKLREALKFFS